MARIHPSDRVPDDTWIAPVISVDGGCAARFAGVRDAFVRNFAVHGEAGAAVAVWHDGALAVDLWGGYADSAARDHSKPTRWCAACLSQRR